MAATSTPQFQSGDVVQLLSGGPKLTVAGYSTEKDLANFLVCFWFDNDGKLQSEPIPGRLLRKVTSE